MASAPVLKLDTRSSHRPGFANFTLHRPYARALVWSWRIVTGGVSVSSILNLSFWLAVIMYWLDRSTRKRRRDISCLWTRSWSGVRSSVSSTALPAPGWFPGLQDISDYLYSCWGLLGHLLSFKLWGRLRRIDAGSLPTNIQDIQLLFHQWCSAINPNSPDALKIRVPKRPIAAGAAYHIKDIEKLKEGGNTAFKATRSDRKVQWTLGGTAHLGNLTITHPIILTANRRHRRGGRIRPTLLSNRATTLFKL